MNEEEYKDVNPLKFIFWMFIAPALFGGGCGELLEFLIVLCKIHPR